MKHLIFIFIFLPLYAGLTHEEQQSLAAFHAPILKMHPEDQSTISAAEWYVTHCALMQRGDDGDQELVTRGEIDLPSLENYPDRSFFLSPDEEGKRGDMASAKTYAHLHEHSNGNVAIEYWLFYPWQGALAGIGLLYPLMKALNVGTHEGDWEHITVYLKPHEQGLAVDSILFARHQQFRGELVAAADVELRDGHPVVYVAQNSHGSYAHNKTWPQLRNFDRTSGKGTEWSAAEHKIALIPNEKGELPAELAWTLYRGNWGDDGPQAPDWIRTDQTGNFPIEVHPFFAGQNVLADRAIPLSHDPLQRRRKGRTRHSPYLDLEVYARARKLVWQLVGAGADQILFDVLEKKAGRADKLLLSDLRSGHITDVPTTHCGPISQLKREGVYIGNIRMIGEGERDLTQPLSCSIRGLEPDQIEKAD